MSAVDVTKFLKLILVNSQEFLDWDQFDTPEKLLAYVCENLVVDPTQLNEIQKLYIGTNEPDFSSIWFNNGPVPFVGIPIGGEFHKIYRYPPNSPFIAINQSVLGYGVRQVTTSEVTAWNLPSLGSPSFWAILDIDLPSSS